MLRSLMVLFMAAAFASSALAQGSPSGGGGASGGGGSGSGGGSSSGGGSGGGGSGSGGGTGGNGGSHDNSNAGTSLFQKSNSTPKSKPKSHSPLKAHCGGGQVAKTVIKNGSATTICTSAAGSGLEDTDLYHQGYVLAKAGNYDWSITVLSQIKNQQQPDVLTMLGYSNRKAGRFETGFSYYQKALALNPNYTHAREYWGEGLMAEGKIVEAKIQLDEIGKISGTGSDDYKTLAKVIEKGA